MTMKHTRTLNPALPLFVFILASVTFSSCYKEPFYKCKIIVTDESSIPVPEASVELWALNPMLSGNTNSQGQIEFEYPHDAVFDVFVTHTASNRTGKGFVKLESREIVTETVVIE